jgi:hypothetical protein
VAYILTKLIDVVGPVREEPEGALLALMDSIKQNRLLHSIAVIKNPAAEGRFIVIAGRRRLLAIQRLGSKKIRAVIRDTDTIQNELITITENFHRLELTPAERDAQIVRYAELLRQLPPEPTKGAHANGAAKPAPYRFRAPRADSVAAGSASSALQVGAQVARDLGIDPRLAQKALHRADALTDEERAVLARASIPAYHVDRIVAIKDVDKRAAVVNAIADGVKFFDAMAGILGSCPREDDDLSPNEWLATLPLTKEKVDQKRFRADALLYRRIQRAKLAFAQEIGWEALREAVEYQGLYFRRTAFFLDCPHPRQWIKCSGCTAGIQAGKEHYGCRGTGYLMN